MLLLPQAPLRRDLSVAATTSGLEVESLRKAKEVQLKRTDAQRAALSRKIRRCCPETLAEGSSAFDGKGLQREPLLLESGLFGGDTSWRSERRSQACLLSRVGQNLLVAYQEPFSPFPSTQPDFNVAMRSAERSGSHAGSLRHQTCKV